METIQIVGPDGKSEWNEIYNPNTEEVIPIMIPRIITFLNLFTSRLAAADGVISNPITKIIPTN